MGGGISGSFAAMLLDNLGHNVTIWDKGRRASGRLSSKEVNSDFSIHVGSKSFDSLPKWMERYISEWVRLKLVRIDGNSLVPIKPLSEIIKHLNKEVEVNYGCKVTNLEERNESVEITVKNQDSIININMTELLLLYLSNKQLIFVIL